ncbi:hypothetical protein [Xylanimonas oleitrophica]|nr:hypothetical protein [Xylanimonas oleitrophica]
MHDAVLTALDQTTVTVYDGEVGRIPGADPGDPLQTPPADNSGRVYPYALVWSTGGEPGPEQDVTRASTGDVWRTHVNIAAGHPTWLMQAIPVVRARLHLLEVAPGVRLTEDEVGGVITKDPDTIPPRWFLPTRWSALTV